MLGLREAYEADGAERSRDDPYVFVSHHVKVRVLVAAGNRLKTDALSTFGDQRYGSDDWIGLHRCRRAGLNDVRFPERPTATRAADLGR